MTEQIKEVINYDQLMIKSYNYWSVYLHENQCYLGRVFLLLKDDKGIEDFLAINEAAQHEFFEVGREVKNSLKKLFQPDKMNYAALSNTSERIHVHFIPRYKDKREFLGKIFDDERWGKNYAPYNRSFLIDKELLFKIRDAIKVNL